MPCAGSGDKLKLQFNAEVGVEFWGCVNTSFDTNYSTTEEATTAKEHSEQTTQRSTWTISDREVAWLTATAKISTKDGYYCLVPGAVPSWNNVDIENPDAASKYLPCVDLINAWPGLQLPADQYSRVGLPCGATAQYVVIDKK